MYVCARARACVCVCACTCECLFAVVFKQDTSAQVMQITL